MTTQRQRTPKPSGSFNDEIIAKEDITHIQVRTGKLEKTPKMTVVGQITIWYGKKQSEPHGKCQGLTDIRTFEFSLQSGERIKVVNVFTSVSRDVIGIQFKTNLKQTEVFGSQSKMVLPLQSPYSSKYYCQYFHGTADSRLRSLQARFVSSLKSPFCAPSRSNTPDNSSTCGTWSSNDSRLSETDESFYSTANTVHSEPMRRVDLERSYAASSTMSSGRYSLGPNSHSLSSLQDAPLDVRELGSHSTSTKQYHHYMQTHRTKPKQLTPHHSYYVGKKSNQPPPPHEALGQIIGQQKSLALNRPIHHHMQKPSFANSKV